MTNTAPLKNAPQVYLASRSPRRSELLHQLGYNFLGLEVDVDESVLENESAETFATRVALDKARAGRAKLVSDFAPVLGADTIIVLDDEILGKPRDRDDGIEMLQRLSGRSHQVISAVAIVANQTMQCLSTSQVTFRKLGLDEVESYWDTGEPADKAGGYAIQGFGAMFIERLEGSYSGVMGLPLFETAAMLRAVSVIPVDFLTKGK